MKSSELHRLIVRNGWIVEYQNGSHVIYAKGTQKYPVPFHGSHEIAKGLEKKICKEMNLKKGV